jgi:hypothetical protein
MQSADERGRVKEDEDDKINFLELRSRGHGSEQPAHLSDRPIASLNARRLGESMDTRPRVDNEQGHADK